MEANPTKAYNQDDATDFIQLNALRLQAQQRLYLPVWLTPNKKDKKKPPRAGAERLPWVSVQKIINPQRGCLPVPPPTGNRLFRLRKP